MSDMDVYRVIEKAMDDATAKNYPLTQNDMIDAIVTLLFENFDITEPTVDACDYCDYGNRLDGVQQDHHDTACPNNSGANKHFVWP